MAMDAVPFDLLRSLLDELKLRFQDANVLGSPRKAWLTHFRDKGDERQPILGVRLDGYQDYVYLRLKPIIEDTVRLLGSLPAAVQTRLWGGPIPEIPVGLMSDSDRIPQWVMAVFELLNASGVGPPLRRVRDLPLDEKPVGFKLGADAELYATLPDFAAASVQAIAILQSWLGDVPKRETEANSETVKPVERQAESLASGGAAGDELQKRVASLERHQKKHAKPLTKTEKTRNQRIKFCCPKRCKNSPETWNEIYHAYNKKFPSDKDASPATLRLSHDRNCPKCRTA